MKMLKVLTVMCILIVLAAPVKSHGKCKQVERPIKGWFYSKVVEEYPSYEILSIFGYATHLGIVFNSSMTFNRPPAKPYIEGILRGAHGNYISFYSWPTMIITDPTTKSGTMSGTVYFSGGTGRFAGCAGEAQLTGTFSMSEDWAKWTVEGSITY